MRLVFCSACNAYHVSTDKFHCDKANLEEENKRLEQAYQKIVTDFVKFKERVEELDILDEFSNFF